MSVHTLPIQVPVGCDALASCGWKVDDRTFSRQLFVDGRDFTTGCVNGPNVGGDGEVFDGDQCAHDTCPDPCTIGDMTFQVSGAQIGQYSQHVRLQR